MKITPASLIERGELNLRQGIKSSLNDLRSIVTSVPLKSGRVIN